MAHSKWPIFHSNHLIFFSNFRFEEKVFKIGWKKIAKQTKFPHSRIVFPNFDLQKNGEISQIKQYFN